MATRNRPRALGIVGDFYHKHAGLRELFERAAPDFEWGFESDPRRVDWSALRGCALLLLSTEDRVEPEKSEARWMDEGRAKSLELFVGAGGGLLAYHSGLASWPEGGLFRGLLGGGFQFHPKPAVEFTVTPEGSHPILAGVEPFTISDEMYFVDCDPATTQALATSSSPRYGSSRAAWCAERGKGRVACVTPGHRPEVLRDPNLTRLLGNAARWCARLAP